MENGMTLSTLPKTWVLDLDGTILKHNGYKTDGVDTVLPGAREYLSGLPDGDTVVILTSRTEEYREMTVSFLADQGIRYDHILFSMPVGERILVNDRKPSGLDTAVAVNLDRDRFRLPEIRRER